MPKFYRQNKKRIDPRYFLNETVERDTEGEEEITESEDNPVCMPKCGKIVDVSYQRGVGWVRRDGKLCHEEDVYKNKKAAKEACKK